MAVLRTTSRTRAATGVPKYPATNHAAVGLEHLLVRGHVRVLFVAREVDDVRDAVAQEERGADIATPPARPRRR